MTERKFTPPTEFPAEYRTRDGRKAIILGEVPKCGKFFLPFLGWIENFNGESRPCHWRLNGSGAEPDRDLRDIPRTVVRWVNVYDGKEQVVDHHDSRARADACAADHRTAVLKLTYTEGELPTVEVEGV